MKNQFGVMHRVIEIKTALYKVKKRALKSYDDLMWRFSGNQKQKIFCIGHNKTGTSSLGFALHEFGYKMGHQPTAERLLPYYAKKKDWKHILEYCKTAQAFQDAPFSWPETWKALVKAYPNAKFILTYRDEEKWYKSITSFHKIIWGQGIRVPNATDLKNANYRYKGWAWEYNRAVWNTPENDTYNKECLLDIYKKHNNEILSFFKTNPNFLAIDVSDQDSYKKTLRIFRTPAFAHRIPSLE